MTRNCEYIFCQSEHSINIVEVSSGNVVKTIPSEEDVIISISLSPDDSFLAVGFLSSSLQNYHVSGKYNLRPYNFPIPGKIKWLLIMIILNNYYFKHNLFL